MKSYMYFASLLGAMAVATVAHAEFATGNQVNVAGTAFGSAGNAATTWGGGYQLGANTSYVDDVFGLPYQIGVSSTVFSPTLIVFSFDFSQWAPQDYPMHALDIYGLKSDLSIFTVTASAGIVVTDGNEVHWQGTGAEITGPPIGNGSYKLVITVEQVPAPGALALLGVAGVFGTRRRRA